MPEGPPPAPPHAPPLAPASAPASAPPPAPASRPRRWLVGGWPVALTGLCCAAAAAALAGGDEDAVGQLGLIQAIPVTYWPCLAIVIGICCQLLRRPRESVVSLTAASVALVVLLHGAAGLVEREPRFPTAYLHAGMVDQIARHGTLLTGLDARFNWAGFFTAAAAFIQATHLPDARSLLKIAPVIAVLAYLPPTLYLARQFLGGWRRPWLAVWVLVILDWVGQDYFAPQTFSFAVHLYCLATALVGLRALTSHPGRDPGTGGNGTHLQRVDVHVQRGCAAVVCLEILAIAMSHQLTPIILTLDVAMLAGLGVIGNGNLVLFSALATAGWICFGADAFWLGHWSTMFGSVGDVGSVMGSAVADRFQGNSTRMLVLGVRAGLAVVTWGTAGLGLLLDARRQRRPQLALAALVLVPFPLLASQSYGGEVALRVLLFSLPAAAVAVTLVVREETLRRVGALVAVAVLMAVAAVLFVVARYGNEDFERVRSQDAAAVEAFYRVASPGAQVVALSGDLPWRHREVFGYDYTYVRPTVIASGSEKRVIDVFTTNSAGNYLIITPGQVVYASETLGLPVSDIRTTILRLTSSPNFRVEYQDGDACILSYHRRTS